MHTYMTPDAFFKPVYTEILVGFDAHDYLGRRRLEKEDICMSGHGTAQDEQRWRDGVGPNDGVAKLIRD